MAIFEVVDDDTGEVFEIEGDRAPTQEEALDLIASMQQESVSPAQPDFTQSPVAPAQPDFTQEPPGFLRTLQGEAELGTSILTGAPLLPLSGAAGIFQSLNPFADPGAGTQAVEAIQNLAFKPGQAGLEVFKSIGEIAKDVTPQFIQDFGVAVGGKFAEIQESAFQKYGPIAGTAVAIAPAAVLEAIPGFFAIKQARKLRTTVADEAIEEIGDQVRASGESSTKAGIPPEAKDYSTIADDINKQNAENLISEIDPAPEIVQSAQNLGVDLNPSHYSTNQKFIEVEQALKANPRSDLSQIEQTAILRIGEKADNLIEELGGNIDKSILDVTVSEDIATTVKALEINSAIAYNQVNNKIPKSTKVLANASRLYIQQRLQDLGGDVALLNKSEKEILRLSKMKNNPTYGQIDQIRRNVGEAQSKQSGPYRNDEEAILKQVYGVISDDQQGVADLAKVGPQYELGRKLVSTRKEIEDQSINLFGRDLQKSLVPRIRAGAIDLTKGDVTTFKTLMKNLPKAKRQEAAATMLNEFFALGGRTKGAIGQGFEKAFQALNRSPGAKKVLFDELPPVALKTFNDLGRVATGIFKAKKFENVSGTGRAVIEALQSGQIFSKVLDSGITRRAASIAGPFGVGQTGVDLAGSILRKGNEEKITKAVEFISSPAFRKAVEGAALGSDILIEGVEKTKIFKNWLTAQRPEIKGEIAAIGFIPWLTQDITLEE